MKPEQRFASVLMDKAIMFTPNLHLAEQCLLQAWENLAKMRFARKEEIEATLNSMIKSWDSLEEEIKELED